jgi:hypothetical protein
VGGAQLGERQDLECSVLSLPAAASPRPTTTGRATRAEPQSTSPADPLAETSNRGRSPQIHSHGRQCRPASPRYGGRETRTDQSAMDLGLSCSDRKAPECKTLRGFHLSPRLSR